MDLRTSGGRKMNSLTTAIELHQRGRIDEAERAYRDILNAEPNNTGASHLLGVIRHQQGRHEEAMDLIGRANGIGGGLRPGPPGIGTWPCAMIWL